jgi:hypothetical protein
MLHSKKIGRRKAWLLQLWVASLVSRQGYFNLDVHCFVLSTVNTNHHQNVQQQNQSSPLPNGFE